PSASRASAVLPIPSSAETSRDFNRLRGATGRPGLRIVQAVFGSLHVGRQWRAGGVPQHGQILFFFAECPLTSRFRQPMGYGVIGNTADSGSAILGSSPGTPAKIAHRKQLGGRMPVSY